MRKLAAHAPVVYCLQERKRSVCQPSDASGKRSGQEQPWTRCGEGDSLPPPNPDDPNTLVQGPITWCVLCTTLLPVIVLDLTGTAPVLHYLPKTNKCHHNGDDTSPWNDQACFTVYRLVFQASVCTAGVRAPGSCWPLLSCFADRVKVRFALRLKLCCQGYMML